MSLIKSFVCFSELLITFIPCRDYIVTVMWYMSRNADPLRLYFPYTESKLEACLVGDYSHH